MPKLKLDKPANQALTTAERLGDRPNHSVIDLTEVGQNTCSPMQALRFLQFALIVVAMLTANCSRSPSLAAKVRAAGGSASLLKDCRAILDEYLKSEKDLWTADDSSLPPTIAALQPQVVGVEYYQDYPMVDIQVSGGFNHHGLMIILTNTPPDFVPRRARYEVSKIADGIFEYRE